MRAELHVEGLDAMRAALQAAGPWVRNGAAQILDAHATQLAATVTGRYPSKTGNLRRGVRLEKVKGTGVLSARVLSNAKHAHLYERGTVKRWRYTFNGKPSRKYVGVMPAGNVLVPEAIRARASMEAAIERFLATTSIPGFDGHLTGAA